MPLNMGKVWDAKILVGMKALLLANLFGGVANLILERYLMPGFRIPQILELSPAQTGAAAAVMTVTALWQIPFCLWMDQKWGLIPTLIVNLVLNGSGTLMAVTPYWLFNPWAILPRLMAAVIKILPNGLQAVPGSMTYTRGITDPDMVLPGICVACAWFAALWVLSRIWYMRKGAQTA